MLAAKQGDSVKKKAAAAPVRAAAKVDGAARADVNPLWQQLAMQLQPKLRVSQPWDPAEVEADQAAEQLLSGNSVRVSAAVGTTEAQRQVDEERTSADGVLVGDVSPPAEDLFASKPRGAAAREPDKVSQADLSVSTAKGEPLPERAREQFERGLEMDLGAVRVHDGPEAARLTSALEARAVTHGRDVYFAPGQYAPASLEGARLLAHELVHVAQQARAGPAVHRQPKAGGATPSYHFNILVTKVEKKEDSILTCLQQVFGVSRATAAEIVKKFNGHWETGGDWDQAAVDKKTYRVNFPVWFYDAISGYLGAGKGGSGTKEGGAGTGDDPKSKKKRSGDFTKLPKTEQQKINDEADKEFWERTQYKPGKKLDTKDPQDKKQAELWLKIRDQLLKMRALLGALPPGARDTLGDPSQYTPAQYDQLLRIGKKLESLSAEDLQLYRIIAAAPSTDLDMVEKGLDAFIEIKEKYRKALEANAQQPPGPAGDKPAPGTPGDQGEVPLEKQLDKAWEGFDKSGFSKMSAADKEATARAIAGQRARTQLKYLASHPGQTALGMAKGLNPAEVAKGVEKDIKEFKGSESSWGKWASGTGATGKVAGWVAGVAAVAWVVMWFIPGVNLVNAMATALAIAMYAGLAAVVLSGASAELHLQAAASAKTEGEFEKQTNAAADEITSFVLGLALLVAAFILKLLGRIGFVQRYLNIGKLLNDAKVKGWAALGVDALKAVRQEAVAAIQGELANIDAELKPAQAEHAALRKQIEGLSPQELMKKIATDPAFAKELGLDPEQAKAFGPAAEGPLGEQGAPKAKAAILDAMDDAAVEAKARVDRFKADVQKIVDDLNAAGDQSSFDAAVERAKKAMAPEEQARISDEAAKAYKDKKFKSAVDDLEAQAAKAKADAEAQAAKAKADAEAQAKAEESSAEQWLDDLQKSLSEAGKKKLDAIRRTQQTAKSTRELVQSKGGQDFLEGKTGPPKIVSDPQKLAAFQGLENDPKFLERPAVKKAATMADEAEAAQVVRSELASEIALRRARASYPAKPGVNVNTYEGVKVLREQPGFKSAADYKAANPDYRGPVYERGGKVYKPVTDIDLLVTEQAGAQPETIRHMEEIKSGAADTPGEAKAQLDTAQDAFKDLAKGDPQVRLELSDGTDVTSKFDAHSAATAKAVTSGPEGPKAWTEKFGVTADDLLALAKEVLKKVKGTK